MFGGAGEFLRGRRIPERQENSGVQEKCGVRRFIGMWFYSITS
jgi:hypothetical protein